MSLTSSLYTGVSGLTNLGDGMQVIGDNIANVNTVGYKSSRYVFQDLLSQSIATQAGTSQVGRGMSLGAVSSDFSATSTESTGVTTDLAIGGEGFFVLNDPDNPEKSFYTRAGNFSFDADGQLTNPQGYIVQGWKLDEDGNDLGSIQDIILESFSSPPKATSEVTVITNLQSNESSQSPLVANEWDSWDEGKEEIKEDAILTTDYVYPTTVQVYDSLGSTHDISIYYDKVSDNTWEYIITTDPSEDKRNLVAETNGLGLLARGTVTYDSNGAIEDMTMSRLTGRIGNITEPTSMPSGSTRFAIENYDAVQSSTHKMDGYNFGFEFDAITGEWDFADLDGDGYVIPAAYNTVSAKAQAQETSSSAKLAAAEAADAASEASTAFATARDAITAYATTSATDAATELTAAGTAATTAGTLSNTAATSTIDAASGTNGAMVAAASVREAADAFSSLYQLSSDSTDNAAAEAFRGAAEAYDESAIAFTDANLKFAIAKAAADIAATAAEEAAVAAQAVAAEGAAGNIIKATVNEATEKAEIAALRDADAKQAAADAEEALLIAQEAAIAADSAITKANQAVTDSTLSTSLASTDADLQAAATAAQTAITAATTAATAADTETGSAAQAISDGNTAIASTDTSSTAFEDADEASNKSKLNAEASIAASAATSAATVSSISSNAVALDPLDATTAAKAAQDALEAATKAEEFNTAAAAAAKTLDPESNIAIAATKAPAAAAKDAVDDSAIATSAAIESAALADSVKTTATIIYSDENVIKLNLDGDAANTSDLTIRFDAPAQANDTLMFDINDAEDIHVQDVAKLRYSEASENNVSTKDNTSMTINNYNALTTDDTGIKLKFDASAGTSGEWTWDRQPDPGKYPDLNLSTSIKGDKDKVVIDLDGDDKADISFNFDDSLTEDSTIQFNIIGSTAWQEVETNEDGYFEFVADFLGSGPEDNDTSMNIAFDMGAKEVSANDFLNDSMSSTSNASASSTVFQNGDGYGAGDLSGVDVDTEGEITGIFSNGELIPLYRVALAKFLNNDGLNKVGGTLYTATRDSGVAITNKAGTNGLGSISPSSLEQSNVDVSTEFVTMITNQRAFQANSKIVTTVDNMLNVVIQMKT